MTLPHTNPYLSRPSSTVRQDPLAPVASIIHRPSGSTRTYHNPSPNSMTPPQPVFLRRHGPPTPLGHLFTIITEPIASSTPLPLFFSPLSPRQYHTVAIVLCVLSNYWHPHQHRPPNALPSPTPRSATPALHTAGDSSPTRLLWEAKIAPHAKLTRFRHHYKETCVFGDVQKNREKCLK